MSTQPNSPRLRDDEHRNRRGVYISLATIVVAVSLAVLHNAAGDTLVLASPGMAHAGSTVDLPIKLKTSCKNLAALEWQISMPPDIAFEVSSSLDEKTVRCNKRHCMLYGGSSLVSSGVIATLKVHLPGSSADDVSIGLQDVLGATSDAASRKIGDASLKLKVQP